MDFLFSLNIQNNILAILGLRALYVILSRGADFLPYLHKGLALVLMFVGAKFLVGPFVTIPTLVSLGVILGIIAASIGLSLVKKPKA
jgi:tellurite resistance protein TerC